MLTIIPTVIFRRSSATGISVIAKRCRSLHSLEKVIVMSMMKIRILPALTDNYKYLVIDQLSKDAIAVDPVEPDSVIHAVYEERANLIGVLTTHHHWDHAGGNEIIAKIVPGLKIYGGDVRISGLTNKIFDNDLISVGSLTIRCLLTPCHTAGHVCYYVTSPEGDRAVFTGDTLFVAGCGRFSEGTAGEMHRAMSILGSLPEETKVLCGHEYTERNLRFAQQVDPGNLEVRTALEMVRDLRSGYKPSVPSSIGKEKLINPFMRVGNSCIQELVGCAGDEVATMAAVRKLKDEY